MTPCDCRCLKLAIVHDVAEGANHSCNAPSEHDARPRTCLDIRSMWLETIGLRRLAAIVGDITPNDGVSDEDKHQLEASAMAQIRDMLGRDTDAGQCLHHLDGTMCRMLLGSQVCV